MTVSLTACSEEKTIDNTNTIQESVVSEEMGIHDNDNLRSIQKEDETKDTEVPSDEKLSNDKQKLEESTADIEGTPSLLKYTDKSVDLNSWELLLVNPWNALPENYEVDKTTLKNGHSIDTRVSPYLQEMMDDARAEGLSPVICSSYRTMEKQKSLFDRQVEKQLSRGYSQKEAEFEAAKWVAVPGTSEHQSALALDIVDLSYQHLDKAQEDTAVQKWLMENSYKYGFILRYPEDKTDITGINYEPWHYRYVGKEVAREIYEQGVCLEEYLLL